MWQKREKSIESEGERAISALKNRSDVNNVPCKTIVEFTLKATITLLTIDFLPNSKLLVDYRID